MDYFEKELLKNLVDSVLEDYPLEYKRRFEDDDVNLAFSIFGSIKRYEIDNGEEEYARLDLIKLFGIDSKKMTKNVMYNTHCSRIVNSITYMLKHGELKIENKPKTLAQQLKGE